MIRRPPRSTRVRSSAASDVYKRQQAQSRWDKAPQVQCRGRGLHVGGGGHERPCHEVYAERVALHRSAVRVHVHAVPVHVGLTCTKDGPVVPVMMNRKWSPRSTAAADRRRPKATSMSSSSPRRSTSLVVRASSTRARTAVPPLRTHGASGAWNTRARKR